MICSLCHDFKRSLAISDFLAFLISIAVLPLLQAPDALPTIHLSADNPALSAAALLLALSLIWEGSLRQLSAHEVQTDFWDEALRVILGAALAAALFGMIFYSAGAVISLGFLTHFILVLAGMALILRRFVPRACLWLPGHQSPGQGLILREKGAGIALERALRNSLGCEVVHLEMDDHAPSSAQMLRVLREQQPDEVVLAPAEISIESLAPILDTCRRYGMPWQLVPGKDPVSGWPTQAFSFAEVPLIAPRKSALYGFNLLIKTTVDIIGGVILFILLMPFMLLASIAIRLDSPGPAILVQDRVGYKRRIFKLYKFRTMYMDNDDTSHREYVKQWIKNKPYRSENGEAAFKIVDDERVTRVGHWLRKFSLDEIPQLINVVRGEMSLVGPRPAMPYELESYEEWHKERFEGPPGLTGIWQVNGRNNLSFDEMVRLDIEYLHNWTPSRDILLLAKTVPTVLSGTGH